MCNSTPTVSTFAGFVCRIHWISSRFISPLRFSSDEYGNEFVVSLIAVAIYSIRHTLSTTKKGENSRFSYKMQNDCAKNQIADTLSFQRTLFYSLDILLHRFDDGLKQQKFFFFLNNTEVVRASWILIQRDWFRRLV